MKEELSLNLDGAFPPRKRYPAGAFYVEEIFFTICVYKINKTGQHAPPGVARSRTFAIAGRGYINKPWAGERARGSGVKAAENLIDARKVGESPGVSLDYFKHFSYFFLADYAHHHVLVRIGVHAAHVDFGRAMVQFCNNLRRKFFRAVGNNLESIPRFQAGKEVIHDDVGDKQVDERTQHGRYLSSVHEEGQKHHAAVQPEREVRHVRSRLNAFDERGNRVSAAARAEPAKHYRKAQPGNNARGNTCKHYFEILAVVCKAVRFRARFFKQHCAERLHQHIDYQVNAQFAIDEHRYEGEYRNVVNEHQIRPGHFAAAKVERHGGKAAHAAGSKAVAVLEEEICAGDNRAGNYRRERVKQYLLCRLLFSADGLLRAFRGLIIGGFVVGGLAADCYVVGSLTVSDLTIAGCGLAIDRLAIAGYWVCFGLVWVVRGARAGLVVCIHLCAVPCRFARHNNIVSILLQNRQKVNRIAPLFFVPPRVMSACRLNRSTHKLFSRPARPMSLCGSVFRNNSRCSPRTPLPFPLRLTAHMNSPIFVSVPYRTLCLSSFFLS